MKQMSAPYFLQRVSPNVKLEETRCVGLREAFVTKEKTNYENPSEFTDKIFKLEGRQSHPER